MNFGYQGWLAWVLLVALAWMPVLSLIVSLPAMLSVKVRPECAGTVYIGESAAASVKTSCLLPVPQLRYRLEVTRTVTGEKWTVRRGESLPTEHCGQLVLQPEKCWVYDYLGLFRWKVRKCTAASVTVRPVSVKTEVPSDLQRHMAKSWRPKPGGGFAENHELRLYRPGDKLNQVHWKLTAKTGKLTVREAMEPLRSRMLLTVDLQGAPEEIDIKMGKLLWLGQYLLGCEQQFEIAALTGDGLQRMAVSSEKMLVESIDRLLGMKPAVTGSVLHHCAGADWCCHIGGGTDEA